MKQYTLKRFPQAMWIEGTDWHCVFAQGHWRIYKGDHIKLIALSAESAQKKMEYILTVLTPEAEWESEALKDLDEFLLPDGTIDYDKLFEASVPMEIPDGNTELNTVEAAEILNVSRPFLLKLLEQGEIPYRKLKNYLRIRLGDVMNYKNAIDREREKVLDELVAEAQEQGMGYE